MLAHPGRAEGHQRQPEQQMEIAPHHRAIHLGHQMEVVMVIVPIDGDIDEAQQIGQEDRPDSLSAWKSAPSGTFSSSTMMVMMMATTPSVMASRRSVSMLCPPVMPC